ncbi:hypothetical protein BLOT_007821 [Blomia tropicalis]|nr:hypothetical protein BLOT_007821 [Blomia tropicalis]
MIKIDPIEPIVDTNDRTTSLNTRFHEFQLSSGPIPDDGHIGCPIPIPYCEYWFGILLPPPYERPYEPDDDCGVLN